MGNLIALLKSSPMLRCLPRRPFRSTRVQLTALLDRTPRLARISKEQATYKMRSASLRSLRSLGLFLFFTSLMLGGCGVKMAKEVGKRPDTGVVTPTSLSGTVVTSDGSTIDLSTIAGSLALTFGSDSCLICRKEAIDFQTHFTANGGLPRNASFLTILIGAVQEDVQDWKTRWGVTWDVAYEPGDSLFRKFCPNQTTPCTITFNRTTNQSRSFYREVSVGEVEREIGPWVY